MYSSTYDLSLAHLESFDVEPRSAGGGATATLVQCQVATTSGAEVTEYFT